MTDPIASAGIVWEPLFAPALILLIGAVHAALAIRSYLPIRRNLGLLVLRLLGIAILCAILFQPMLEESFPQRHPNRVALVGIDTSKSMREADGAGQTTRIDGARQLLAESGLVVGSGGEAPLGEVLLFQFNETSAPIGAAQLPALQAEGETTHFHQSIATMLDALPKDANCVGVFLFTDGHDFELTPAQRTAGAARARQTAIYPVALGKQQTIPDVSVGIASFQPYTFVSQRTKIQAAVRLMGSDSRPLRVELYREGKLVRDRKISAESGFEVPVAFDVLEESPGQFEYEVRVSALAGERELENNRAFTFLNVTDAQIPVLLVEGAPHWDTTFLRRTLSRNARVQLTSVLAVGGGKPIVTGTGDQERKLPESETDFSFYPLVILGRDVDRVLSEEACANLAQAVERDGTTLVLARGRPGKSAVFDQIAPAAWTETVTGPVRLVKGRGTSRVVPIEVLGTAPGGAEALPDLPIALGMEAPKMLAAVEALAEDADLQESSPAFVFRRHGTGQVLAVAVGGLWRWSLNAGSEAANNVYDRFWNQLLLNLIAQSSATPGNEARLSISSANVALGEKIHFTFHPKEGAEPPTPTVFVQRGDKVIASVPLARDADGTAWRGTYVGDEAGRFRGTVSLPGRTLESRFSVYVENRETTEVSPDYPYLRRLASASGGKLLDEGSLRETIEQLARAAVAEADAPRIVRQRPLWDRPWIFYLLFGILGLEWFLRMRRGMV